MAEPDVPGGSPPAPESRTAKPDPRTGYPPDNPFNLASTVIDIPLLQKMQEQGAGSSAELLPVIIDVNLYYKGGNERDADSGRLSSQERARDRVLALLKRTLGPRRLYATPKSLRGVDRRKTELSSQYLFAALFPADITTLLSYDRDGLPEEAAAPPSAVTEGPSPPDDTVIHSVSGGAGRHDSARTQRAVYRIWYDHPINPLLHRTLRTVKADAAQIAFGCSGADICWAVVDSGIDGSHPHFMTHQNLKLSEPLEHQDFTTPGGSQDEVTRRALTDTFGHGTHVAGIIAGELVAGETITIPDDQGAPSQLTLGPIVAYQRQMTEDKQVTYVQARNIQRMSGMAPECKLVSLKALDDNGKGSVSNIITAIAYIQQMNGFGRKLHIHGVNLSVGYGYDPEWFACGQSPLCVEVDRLVKSGVVVVVAAGNTGYGTAQSQEGPTRAGFDVTINDPGNAEMAITVGSTHREMPHVYGVSYFSSKGPTGDGRDKPDLVAPGEKVLSCASRSKQAEIAAKLDPGAPPPQYREESGTSMAAPHVSGVIAAFLSVRAEYIGQPEKVKEIFMAAATDLKRQRHFQGCGLVDLMRAVQSV